MVTKKLECGPKDRCYGGPSFPQCFFAIHSRVKTLAKRLGEGKEEVGLLNNLKNKNPPGIFFSSDLRHPLKKPLLGNFGKGEGAQKGGNLGWIFFLCQKGEKFFFKGLGVRGAGISLSTLYLTFPRVGEGVGVGRA